jgi:hypothetical protein
VHVFFAGRRGFRGFKANHLVPVLSHRSRHIAERLGTLEANDGDIAGRHTLD